MNAADPLLAPREEPPVGLGRSCRPVASVAAGQLRPRVVVGPPLFALRNVTKQYVDRDGRAIVVLRDASLEIGRGLTALIGPSGQGKSTLLNLLGGLDLDYDGELRCNGRAVPRAEGAALDRYRGSRVSYVFQDLNLISHLTAQENVALPLLCRGVARRDALHRAADALRTLGLDELAARRPVALSGGQRQRVAIARALVSGADVILADEPTGSLDPENAERVMTAFARLCRRTGRPCVLVTHNVRLAAAHCDRVLRLEGARVEQVLPREGPTASPGRPVVVRSLPAPACTSGMGGSGCE